MSLRFLQANNKIQQKSREMDISISFRREERASVVKIREIKQKIQQLVIFISVLWSIFSANKQKTTKARSGKSERETNRN